MLQTYLSKAFFNLFILILYDGGLHLTICPGVKRKYILKVLSNATLKQRQSQN